MGNGEVLPDQQASPAPQGAFMATAIPVGRVGPVAAFLAVWLAGAGAGQNVARPRIDAVFDEWNRHDSPGCALGVYENGYFVGGCLQLNKVNEQTDVVEFTTTRINLDLIVMAVQVFALSFVATQLMRAREVATLLRELLDGRGVSEAMLSTVSCAESDRATGPSS